MLSRSRLNARLQVLAAALLFSTGGMAVKSCGLGGWQIASFRSGVAALTLLLLLRAARGGWSGRTWIAAATYAATMILFVLANRTTTAINAVFLQSTAPLYILLLGPRLLGERGRRGDLAMMAAMALGLGLFLAGSDAASLSAPAPRLGNVLGAAAGFCWALTVIALRWLERDGVGAGSAPAVAAGNLLAFAVALPLALPLGESQASDWLWVGYLGVFQIGMAYILLIRGLRRLPALEVALLLLAEPVLNPLWAFLGHGEVPGNLALAGALVILGATAVKAWTDRQTSDDLGGAPD